MQPYDMNTFTLDTWSVHFIMSHHSGTMTIHIHSILMQISWRTTMQEAQAGNVYLWYIIFLYIHCRKLWVIL